MRVFASLAVAAVLSTLTSPAAAEWQWTGWGNTPADVVARSEGRAEPSLGQPKWKAQTTGPMTVAGVEFKVVRFGFADDRLTEISMSAPAVEFGKLEAALGATFGQPVAQEQGAFASRTYRDPARGNVVQIKRWGETVALTYKPIPAGL